ncbi:hypothetical protein ACFYO1_08045 [Nocardia sp. NPDC006044]
MRFRTLVLTIAIVSIGFVAVTEPAVLLGTLFVLGVFVLWRTMRRPGVRR